MSDCVCSHSVAARHSQYLIRQLTAQQGQYNDNNTLRDGSIVSSPARFESGCVRLFLIVRLVWILNKNTSPFRQHYRDTSCFPELLLETTKDANYKILECKFIDWHTSLLLGIQVHCLEYKYHCLEYKIIAWNTRSSTDIQDHCLEYKFIAWNTRLLLGIQDYCLEYKFIAWNTRSLLGIPDHCLKYKIIDWNTRLLGIPDHCLQ